MIELRGVTKSFGPVRAVDDLSFAAAPGRVTGFLGPNGAGKTTSLRILLGLVRPDAGSATVGGVPYASRRAGAHRLGAVLEAAASFHPGRTAPNHLRVLCDATGLPGARPCSGTRRCWSWTSRPTGWTPPASAGCAG